MKRIFIILAFLFINSISFAFDNYGGHCYPTEKVTYSDLLTCYSALYSEKDYNPIDMFSSYNSVIGYSNHSNSDSSYDTAAYKLIPTLCPFWAPDNEKSVISKDRYFCLKKIPTILPDDCDLNDLLGNNFKCK